MCWRDQDLYIDVWNVISSESVFVDKMSTVEIMLNNSITWHENVTYILIAKMLQ